MLTANIGSITIPRIFTLKFALTFISIFFLSVPLYANAKNFNGNTDVGYQHPLVDLAKKTINTSSYSRYKLGGNQFDLTKGIYIIDCSAYVDHLLKAAFPKAYDSLVSAMGSQTPNSKDYYNFFVGLNHNPNPYWSQVNNVDQLHPGDILVFTKNRSSRASGHIMVVVSKPTPQADGYLIKVADSSPYKHSKDTREASKATGIGMGTLAIKAGPTGQPNAYAWKAGSSWNHSVKFAMARPRDPFAEHFA